MAGWTRQITSEQERAVYVAVLDGGMSAARAAREAAAGTLPGVGKFTISATTAQRYARDERTRRSRERQLSPENWEATQSQLEQEIRGWVLDAMDNIRAGQSPRINLDHARATQRLLKELRTPGRRTSTGRIPSEAEQDESTTTPVETESVVERMLRRHDERANNDAPPETASAARASSALTRAREEVAQC